jgi:hypothetical protein
MINDMHNCKTTTTTNAVANLHHHAIYLILRKKNLQWLWGLAGRAKQAGNQEKIGVHVHPSNSFFNSLTKCLPHHRETSTRHLPHIYLIYNEGDEERAKVNKWGFLLARNYRSRVLIYHASFH